MEPFGVRPVRRLLSCGFGFGFSVNPKSCTGHSTCFIKFEYREGIRETVLLAQRSLVLLRCAGVGRRTHHFSVGLTCRVMLRVCSGSGATSVVHAAVRDKPPKLLQFFRCEKGLVEVFKS